MQAMARKVDTAAFADNNSLLIQQQQCTPVECVKEDRQPQPPLASSSHRSHISPCMHKPAHHPLHEAWLGCSQATASVWYKTLPNQTFHKALSRHASRVGCLLRLPEPTGSQTYTLLLLASSHSLTAMHHADSRVYMDGRVHKCRDAYIQYMHPTSIQ